MLKKLRKIKMILCSNMCYPCCDFCVHAKHTTWITKSSKTFNPPPDGCDFYDDIEHQNLALDSKYCTDFQCIEAEIPNKWIKIDKEFYEKELEKRRNKKWTIIDIFKNN